MDIRLDHKFIFVHIPKTAGSSISHILSNLPPKKISSDLRVINRIRRESFEAKKMHKHVTAQEIKCWTGYYIWKRCFTFTFVRNPWDLMVSSYFWWLNKAQKWNKFNPQIKEIQLLGNFNAFMHSKYGQEMINEIKANFFDYISNGNNQIIVKFIGKFENLEEDWEKICDSIGIEHRKLPHINKGERNHYREYYNDETRDIVAERFKKSIEMFEYEF